MINVLFVCCRRCGLEKPLAEFNKNIELIKRTPRVCRACYLARNNGYRRANPGPSREASRKWHQKNREKVLARLRKRDPARHAIYARERRRKNLHIRIQDNIRRRINEYIRKGWKSANTAALLGCTVEALKLHIERLFEPGMTWENYGPVWHIDHVRPCASFDLTIADQQHECFHFTNLQPLFESDNLRKSATYCDPATGVTRYFRKSGNQHTVDPGMTARQKCEQILSQ